MDPMDDGRAPIASRSTAGRSEVEPRFAGSRNLDGAHRHASFFGPPESAARRRRMQAQEAVLQQSEAGRSSTRTYPKRPSPECRAEARGRRNPQSSHHDRAAPRLGSAE